MIKLLSSILFATSLYGVAFLIASVIKADLGVTLAFLLAVLIIEDRLPPTT